MTITCFFFFFVNVDVSDELCLQCRTLCPCRTSDAFCCHLVRKVSPGLAKYCGDSRSRDNYNHLPTSRTAMLPDTGQGHLLQQTDTLYDLWESCHDTNGGMSCCYATGDSTWSDNGGSVRADLSCPSPLFLRPTPLPSDVVVLTKGMQWS